MTHVPQWFNRPARLALLAMRRPVEFYDRAIGRRERAHQAVPPTLNARTVDPVTAAHTAIGESKCASCDGELAQTRSSVLSRLTGAHHHDGGAALAEMLWVIVRHRRPTVAIETGVARGVSSAFILDAMDRNGHGHLWSIDLPPLNGDWEGQTGVAIAEEMKGRWTYVRGASRRVLRPLLAGVGSVDLFVHDGLHTAENMLSEMRTVWPHLSENGVLVLDDADDNDAVLRFSAEVAVDPLLVREPDKEDVVALIVRH